MSLIKSMNKDKEGMTNPWKTISVNKVYENPWVVVDHHEVINPNGNPGIYGTVGFKNIAIAILPIDSDGNITLVGQFRFPTLSYSWEIPEGGSPIGQNILINAAKELKEETGIIANSYTELFRCHTSNSVSNEFAIGYLAQDLRYELSEPEDTEELSIKRVKLDELLRMISRHEITDALTIMCAWKLKLNHFSNV